MECQYIYSFGPQFPIDFPGFSLEVGYAWKGNRCNQCSMMPEKRSEGKLGTACDTGGRAQPACPSRQIWVCFSGPDDGSVQSMSIKVIESIRLVIIGKTCHLWCHRFTKDTHCNVFLLEAWFVHGSRRHLTFHLKLHCAFSKSLLIRRAPFKTFSLVIFYNSKMYSQCQ